MLILLFYNFAFNAYLTNKYEYTIAAENKKKIECIRTKGHKIIDEVCDKSIKDINEIYDKNTEVSNEIMQNDYVNSSDRYRQSDMPNEQLRNIKNNEQNNKAETTNSKNKENSMQTSSFFSNLAAILFVCACATILTGLLVYLFCLIFELLHILARIYK